MLWIKLRYYTVSPIKGVRPSPYATGVPNSQAGVIISPASTDGLTVLATGQRQYAILVHYQLSYNTAHTHCCSPMALCAAGCILQAKLPSLALNTQPHWMYVSNSAMDCQDSRVTLTLTKNSPLHCTVRGWENGLLLHNKHHNSRNRLHSLSDDGELFPPTA